MKVSTSDRLKYLMETRNLRQADILEKIQPLCERYGVKIPRNAISQYVTGKVLPKQDKLTILGMALGVSEIWLMGYDVPMERNANVDGQETVSASQLATEEQELVTLYRSLNRQGRDVLMSTARAFAGNPDMQKEAQSSATA